MPRLRRLAYPQGGDDRVLAGAARQDGAADPQRQAATPCSIW
jgi:hypothetical protein